MDVGWKDSNWGDIVTSHSQTVLVTEEKKEKK